MRFLKIVLTAVVAALAVLAGLMIGALAAATSVVLFFSRRSRKRESQGRIAPLGNPAHARPTRAHDVDIIDVTATEVPADPGSR
ncbi:MAG: hypothetical protein ABIZ81_01385 [Opitutaceae bacterium]